MLQGLVSLAMAALAAPVAEEDAARVTAPGFDQPLLRRGDMWIAGQPTMDGLRWAMENGVTLVINLRTPQERESLTFDGEAAAPALGMRYVSIPVASSGAITAADLAEARAAMDAVGGGVLIHCRSGVRAGHFAERLNAQGDVAR